MKKGSKKSVDAVSIFVRHVWPIWAPTDPVGMSPTPRPDLISDDTTVMLLHRLTQLGLTPFWPNHWSASWKSAESLDSEISGYVLSSRAVSAPSRNVKVWLANPA